MLQTVQFDASEGGHVEIVLAKWFTPEKTQLFWPPKSSTKDQQAYTKLLQESASPDPKNGRMLYGVQRVFYQTDTSNHSSRSGNKEKLLPHSVDKHLLEKSPSQSDTSGHCNCSQDKLVSLMANLKAQNDAILSILQDGDNHMKPQTLKPEFKFPVESMQELEKVEQLLTVDENYTNLVAYFKSLGGQGVNNKVSRAMKAALSESMASKFNFYGKRSDKKAFGELRLRASVVESIKSESLTEKQIEDSIKVWLKHAPERAKKALNKTT